MSRDVTIAFRTKAEIKQALKDQAAKMNMSFAEYMNYISCASTNTKFDLKNFYRVKK